MTISFYFFRELLHNFLKSASKVLSSNGEIHIALCEGQGGTSSSTPIKWKQSWKAAEYAAECGLLIMDVLPFEVSRKIKGKKRFFNCIPLSHLKRFYIFFS